MKKILFYTHNIFTKENPVGYRIQQYFPYLQAGGFAVSLMTTKIAFAKVLEEAARADIVVVQRLLLSPVKLSLLKALARKIIYDFDDAVMYGSSGESETRRKRFGRMIKASRAVFCGNPFLLEAAKAYKTDGLYYMPTVVNTDEYPVKEPAGNAPFVVGWIGSSSTLRYLEEVRDVLLFFGDKADTECRIIADKPFQTDKPGIIFQKWNKDKEKTMLLDFDMGIMPVKDDVWSRGKCGLKLIQYMAAGLPSVAHPIGAAEQMITDGVNGFLRTDRDGWIDAIERIRNDESLRKRMGKAARETAEERYSLKVWGPRFVEIVNSL
jgi:glycosyltransferase involved in cell wall biosynthesis